jgi:hypothetical protein
MKKIPALLGIVLLFVVSSLFADLLSAYKKGEIMIIPDSTFGTKTQWDMLFKEGNDKWLAFLPDGSFFRTCTEDGKIHKFDEKGNLILSFAQKGQGPGDLQRPAALDILDGKYLIVNDSGNMRLSVFDLDGKYIKSIKTEHFINNLVALSNNKVALVVTQPQPAKGGAAITRYSVLIKDLESGQETALTSFDEEFPIGQVVVKVSSFAGAVYLARIGPDKLLVAYSKGPEISLYSFNGEKLSSFVINMERTKIKWEHLEYVGETSSEDKAEQEKFKQFITMNKDKILLPEYLPYYPALAVDSDNHILVYVNNLAQKSRDVSFQVYTPEGKLVGTTKINPGEYELSQAYPRWFFKNYLYVTLAKKGGDGTQFLSRVKIG